MTTQAQKKAAAKYRKEKEVQRVVRFSPNEADLLEHLERQPNRAGYIKSLIRADMEGRVGAKPVAHSFPSANMGAVRFSVTRDLGAGKDVLAEVQDGPSREWADMDGGTAEEMFRWLLEEGVEPVSALSFQAAHDYVASVLLDGSKTPADAFADRAEMTEEGAAEWMAFRFPEMP